MNQSNQPALFALQGERDALTPNPAIAHYEEQLAASLGLDQRDAYLSSGGTTTPNGDSSEDS